MIDEVDEGLAGTEMSEPDITPAHKWTAVRAVYTKVRVSLTCSPPHLVENQQESLIFFAIPLMSDQP